MLVCVYKTLTSQLCPESFVKEIIYDCVCDCLPHTSTHLRTYYASDDGHYYGDAEHRIAFNTLLIATELNEAGDNK